MMYSGLYLIERVSRVRKNKCEEKIDKINCKENIISISDILGISQFFRA